MPSVSTKHVLDDSFKQLLRDIIIPTIMSLQGDKELTRAIQNALPKENQHQYPIENITEMDESLSSIKTK